MKFYVELAIAAVLLLLVYDKPTELTEFSNTIVGKMILIAIVGCVAKVRGMGAGLMAALVMLILLHDGREGFQEGADSKSSQKKKTNKDNKKKKKGATNSILGEFEKHAKSISGKDKKKDNKKDGDKDDDKKEKKETFSVSDVRVTEGMRNMESYSNTIAAAKFQNGYTGNREPFNGFI
jgi:hypothetical protein